MEISRTEYTKDQCITGPLLCPYLKVKHGNVSFRYYVSMEKQKVINVLEVFSKDELETLLLMEIDYFKSCRDRNCDTEEYSFLLNTLQDFWEMHGGDKELWTCTYLEADGIP